MCRSSGRHQALDENLEKPKPLGKHRQVRWLAGPEQ